MASTIRRAVKRDASVLADLWTEFLHEQANHDERLTAAEDARERWENDFPVWIEDATRRIFVVEIEEKIVGFVSAHRTAPPPIYESHGEVYLDELYVHPAHRRDGLGSELVDAVVAWCDEVGGERVRLQALTQNDDAGAFWEARGANRYAMTYTMERPKSKEKTEDEGTRKIGFR